MNRKSFFLILVMIIAIALFASPAFAKGKGKGKGKGKSRGDMPMAKGNLLLGGGLDASFLGGSNKMEMKNSDVTQDITEIGLEGLCGYFVIRGLEVGGILEVDYEKMDDDTTETIGNGWKIGPQVGYFYPINSSFSIFGLGVLGYMKDTETTEVTVGTTKTKTETTGSGFYFEPRGGVVVHLNKSVGLYASLFFSYGSGSGEVDSGGATSDFDVTTTRYGIKIGILGFLDI